MVDRMDVHTGIRVALRGCIVVLGATFALPVHAAPPSTKVAATAPKPSESVEMVVAGVVPAPDGPTVVLVCADEQVLLPVVVGVPEAMAIHARLEHMAVPRPMTHDLLETVMHDLGGTVDSIRIDAREGGIVGTVFLRAQGKLVSVDARPSDAIALALGSHAPVMVSRVVLDRAGIHAADLEPDAATGARPSRNTQPGRPAEGPGVLAL